MREKILLLVEDNPKDEALTLRALRNQEVQNTVIVARDGVEALEFLHGQEEQPGRSRPLPELVLLDLKLPKIDGLEVLRRIRAEERTRLLPVVLLTSSVEESDLFQGYQLGINSYVRKPVDFVEFNQVVRQLGLYWLVLNRPPPVSGY